MRLEWFSKHPVCKRPCWYLVFIWRFFCCSVYNCSQDCWIDWNSAALCFKRPFSQRGYERLQIVRPLLITKTLHKYGKFGLVPITMYTCVTYFTGRPNKIRLQNKNIIWSWPITGNRSAINTRYWQWMYLFLCFFHTPKVRKFSPFCLSLFMDEFKQNMSEGKTGWMLQNNVWEKKNRWM